MNTLELQDYYMNLPSDLSGSRSKNRFRVELLWGVNKMLELLNSPNGFVMIFDYVCDIELHFNNKFEFYQIKSHKPGSSSYTPDKLTKRKSDKDDGSIIGKLYILNKDCSDKIKLAIVSNVAFSDNNKTNCNDITCFNDMSKETKSLIEERLKKELQLDTVDLSSVYYICTNMDLTNPESTVIGKLVLTIKSIKNCETSRPVALYKNLYDEVEKRACYENSLKSYNELVDKKGIERSYL